MPMVNGKKYAYTAAGKKKAKAAAKKTGKKVSYAKGKSSPKPKNKALYARVKAEAKKKYKVWPSAYASGWLTKEYKKRGGTYE